MAPLSYARLSQVLRLDILELDYGGQVIRVAERPLRIPSAGGLVEVLGGLRHSGYDDGLALLSTEAPEQSVSVELILPQLDVGALIAQGHDLGAATATLSRWVEGTPWEARQVLVRARISEPLYGAAGEPITFTLSSEPWQDRSVIPPAWARITAGTAGTWEAPPPEEHGSVYPLVFGQPGVVDGELYAGSPAPRVTRTELEPRLLVAGHHVSAIQVSIMHEDTPDAWVDVPIDNERDRGLHEVATAILPESDIGTNHARGYWVAWPGAQEGLHDRRRDRGIRTAGELLDYLLDRTAIRVDQGRMDAAVPLLEPYRVGGYIDARVNVWEWVREHLLPILPISLRVSAEGLYPVVWRYTATVEQAIEHLSADTGQVVRMAPVRYTDAALVANELTLEWAYDARLRRYMRASTVSGDETDGLPSSHILRVSRARYGPRAAEPIQSAIVWDASTAHAILSWRAARDALPARMLAYDGGPELQHLELGDVVTVTDSEVHLRRQVAIVTELIPRSDGRTGLVLRTIEGWE